MAATGVGGKGNFNPTPPTGRSPAHPIVSPGDWRVLLLKRIGAPVTDTNLTALQAWALSESGYNSQYGTNMAGPGYFNPLAITDGYGVPAAGSINSDGVLAFNDTSAGVEATVRFLQHGYAPVIDALRSSNAVELYAAVNQSGWCKGCQGGQYPVDLATYLHGGSVPGGSNQFRGMGAIGQVLAAKKAGTSFGSGSDSGGLYGQCKISSTSVPLAPFSIPTGGFGCYIEKTLIFGGLAVGGALLMAVGLGLVILPSLRGKAGVVGDVASFGAGLAASRFGVKGSTPSTSGAAGSAASETAKAEAQALREKRARELHAARVRAARGMARRREAEAREAETRAPTGRQRIRAAGKGQVRAAGPVAGRLEYETPGV